VAHEVPHHYLEYRGGHGWQAWSQVFPVALCLHMRGEACELEDDRFYDLEIDDAVINQAVDLEASPDGGRRPSAGDVDGGEAG
jgi:hypothetical protein